MGPATSDHAPPCGSSLIRSALAPDGEDRTAKRFLVDHAVVYPADHPLSNVHYTVPPPDVKG